MPVFLNYPRYVRDENTQLPFKFVGGFGIGSDKIGTIYTVYGIACGLIQFFMFPWLCARFGVLHVYRVASKFFLHQHSSQTHQDINNKHLMVYIHNNKD